ncbi:hypothetical protein DQ384_31790 [Sphaerisporangium album]|uniref:Lipoprotein n=1 Tax=Sphaerisporangium album TaxID=509200 RepID=A0A367F521_9ACTN|nr:hypothetical protein [Sphaerisporangium album]RCG25443.1 hypothetical protein DQ384_31790 [Sphaerisporangium album]
MMRRLTASLCLVAVLAGCASTPPGTATPTPTPTGTAQTLEVFKELARCVRSHGMPNIPDPVVEPRTGKVGFPDGVGKPGQSVMKACQSIVDRLPPSAKGRTVSAADLAKLRQLSRCMREHGLRDWPDPTADGEIPLPKRLIDLGKRGIRTQLEACRQYFPKDGISVKAPAGTNG